MKNRSGAALLEWLLKNELRLWWRRTTGVKQFWVWAVILGVGVAGTLFLLWLGLSSLRAATAGTALPDAAVWVAAGLWLMGLFFAFNQCLGESVVVLYERGDLDLLLSSPVSSKAIFAARLLTVALSAFFGFCFFVVPGSVVAVLVGFPELLGVYPALVSLCLVAASLAMLVMLWVVRWVGARRARSMVQILNVLFTLLFVFAAQLPNFLLSSGTDFSGFLTRLQAWAAPGSVLASDSWLWFPARAMLLDPVSVVLTLGVSGAIAAVTVYALSQTFVQGTQQSVSQKRSAPVGEGLRMKGGFNRVVLTKEWRTIRRHPYLISQVALQVALVVPLTWVMLQGSDGDSLMDIGRAANVALPFLAGQLAFVLTFVCVSGEEAADLLKSSPMSGGTFRRLKQLSALIPVWLLLSPAVVFLIFSGHAWLSSVVAALGASIGSSFLRLWNSRPVAFGEMFRQRKMGQSDFVMTLIEAFSPWAWVGLGSALYARSGSFVLLAVVILVLLFSLGYWRGRQLGSFLHY